MSIEHWRSAVIVIDEFLDRLGKMDRAQFAASLRKDRDMFADRLAGVDISPAEKLTRAVGRLHNA